MHYVGLIVIVVLSVSAGFFVGVLWRSSLLNREIENAYSDGVHAGYTQGIAEICPD